MKIDLHVHSSERSVCSVMTADEQIQAAIRAGLDGIAITDHDQLVPPAELAALRQRYAPFVLFTGIEVSASDNHWVVIGLPDPALERLDWRYPDLHRFVRAGGGLILLAHPFRYKPQLEVNLDRHTPDGIEVRSSNTPRAKEGEIRQLAARLGMVPVTNSDAHHPGVIGQYATRLPRPAANDRELIAVFQEMKTTPADPSQAPLF